MARKTKPKAPSVEPVARQAASDATPEQSPQADQQPTASAQADSDAQQADSHTTTQTDAQTAEHAVEQAQHTATQDAGNVPEAAAGSNGPLNHTHVRDRLQKHPDWKRVIATVREMRADPKLAAMLVGPRERFIWGEMDRLYPAKRQSSAVLENDKPSTDNDLQIPPSPKGGNDRIQGLGDIPPAWPSLPANAALAVEVGWVQANRLYVVEELASGGTRVHLDRAHEPAPSRAAIGWLETSIRSYAKYVEVAAKVTGSGDEDGEQVKRERMAIEEIRGLLAEMAGNPPGPGR